MRIKVMAAKKKQFLCGTSSALASPTMANMVTSPAKPGRETWCTKMDNDSIRVLAICLRKSETISSYMAMIPTIILEIMVFDQETRPQDGGGANSDARLCHTIRGIKEKSQVECINMIFQTTRGIPILGALRQTSVVKATFSVANTK